jgi:5-methyltetrahydrofolate--homocysteine methyltransferase
VGVIGDASTLRARKRLKEALRSGNHDYVMSEAINQANAGAQILDVNAGLPEIDERGHLVRLVSELSGVTTLPLQIDSADPEAIEAAVRAYPGKGSSTRAMASGDLETVLPHCQALRVRHRGPHAGRGRHSAHGRGPSCVARKIVAAAERWASRARTSSLTA